MQRIGIAESIVHRCLSHTTKNGKDGKAEVDSIKLGRIYLRHAYKDEMRDAWMRLGAHLEQVMGPVESLPEALAA